MKIFYPYILSLAMFLLLNKSGDAEDNVNSTLAGNSNTNMSLIINSTGIFYVPYNSSDNTPPNSRDSSSDYELSNETISAENSTGTSALSGNSSSATFPFNSSIPLSKLTDLQLLSIPGINDSDHLSDAFNYVHMNDTFEVSDQSKFNGDKADYDNTAECRQRGEQCEVEAQCCVPLNCFMEFRNFTHICADEDDILPTMK